MRICFFFTNFHKLFFTGQPTLIYRVAQYIVRQEKQVYIISNGYKKEIKIENNLNIYLVKGDGNVKTFLFNSFKTLRYFMVINPDIIHVHGNKLIIYAGLINLLLKKRFVYSMCETLDVAEGIFKKLLILFLKNAEKIFVTSNYIKKQLIEHNINKDKIETIRLQANCNFIKANIKEKLSNDILFFGDSSKDRGFDIIYLLAKKLPQYNFKILIRWRKDCQKNLEELHKMENAKVFYYPYQEKLEEIIVKSKLILLPYRWMAVRPPLSLIESMVLGKCVLTSFLGGNEEIIENGVNGFMVDFNNGEEVISKIKYLISNEQVRQKIGENAKDTIKNMYAGDEYQKINKIYELVDRH